MIKTNKNLCALNLNYTERVKKKCPITFKMYCLKYENVMVDRMVCFGRVIIPSYFGTLLIEIIARMTEQQSPEKCKIQFAPSGWVNSKTSFKRT